VDTLPRATISAPRTHLPLVLIGLIVVAVAAAAGLSALNTALGGANTITKTADNNEVSSGSQIGFTIDFTYDQTANHTVFLVDNLPPGAGLDWQVGSSQGANSCGVTGSVPNQTLTCTGTSDAGGNLHMTVHVTSPTADSVCQTVTNRADAGGSGESNVNASDTITVQCPNPPSSTPTPTPSPTQAPTATPSPSPTPTSSAAPTPTPTAAPTERQGDFNCDGGVDQTDLQILLENVALGTSFQGPPPCPALGSSPPLWGDVNCDGLIDVHDLLAMLLHLAELPYTKTDLCPEIGDPFP
jgi:hypothetical protein